MWPKAAQIQGHQRDFSIGTEYNISVAGEIENPNPFSVSFFPLMGVTMSLDSQGLGYEVIAPKGVEISANEVTFEAQGVAGERVTFNYRNTTGVNRPWLYRPSEFVGGAKGFQGMFEFWQDKVVALP